MRRVAVILAIALPMVAPASWAQVPAVPSYTMTHPGKNPPWYGLATPDGRYEVLLGDGCDAISADMNVVLERSDDSNEATWTLNGVCSVAEWHWVGNAPCEQNADSVCDVEYA